LNYHIDIQRVDDMSYSPNDEIIKQWISHTLQANQIDQGELCIRIVDEKESRELNNRYRQKDYPTNILSFPINHPDEITLEKALLGDCVICPSVLEKEVKENNYPIDEHWAHIIIHGILHLLGYDHIDDHDAELMENKEIVLMKQLGYDNPYEQENDYD